jgi:hypothetical protein
MIVDFRAVDKKSDICLNGVEQMKNRVEQIFRADDHDPTRQLPDPKVLIKKSVET